MTGTIFRQVLIFLAVAATIVMNFLANALPLNNLTTGQISDGFRVLFVPAGYVFSIWGLIYLGLILYAIYQILPAQRKNNRIRSIDLFFLISCLANVSWLFLWHYRNFPMTLTAMAILLVSLVAVYVKLEIGRTPVSTGEKWLVQVPFSIYLGWISVATVANVSIVLTYLNWGGWGISASSWTVIMIAIVVLLSLLVNLNRFDLFYTLVLVWAFIGIAVKQADSPIVARSAWIAAILTAMFFAVTGLYRRRSSR